MRLFTRQHYARSVLQTGPMRFTLNIHMRVIQEPCFRCPPNSDWVHCVTLLSQLWIAIGTKPPHFQGELTWNYFQLCLDCILQKSNCISWVVWPCPKITVWSYFAHEVYKLILWDVATMFQWELWIVWYWSILSAKFKLRWDQLKVKLLEHDTKEEYIHCWFV